MEHLLYVILAGGIIVVIIFLFIKKIIKTLTFLLTLLGTNLIQRLAIAAYYYSQTKNPEILLQALINPIRYYDSVIFENPYLAAMGLISWYIFFLGVATSMIKSFIEKPLEIQFKKHERIIISSALSLLFLEGFSGGLPNFNMILYYVFLNFILPSLLIMIGTFLIFKAAYLALEIKSETLEYLSYYLELYKTAKEIYPDAKFKVMNKIDFLKFLNEKNSSIEKISRKQYVITGDEIEGEAYEISRGKYAVIYIKRKSKNSKTDSSSSSNQHSGEPNKPSDSNPSAPNGNN